MFLYFFLFFSDGNAKVQTAILLKAVVTDPENFRPILDLYDKVQKEERRKGEERERRGEEEGGRRERRRERRE